MGDCHDRVERLRLDVIRNVARLDTAARRRRYCVSMARTLTLEEAFVAGFVDDVLGALEPVAPAPRPSPTDPRYTRVTPAVIEVPED